jgi:hypothetical protein
MKKYFLVVITVLLVSLLASACGLSNLGGNTNTALTPNMTLTALFDTSKNIPATVTPIYIVVTNTAEPVIPTDTTAPTNTAAPTSTTVPTVAPSSTSVPTVPPPPPVMARAGTLMQAGYISTAPVIDGSWNEWKDYTTQYPITSIVYGASHWTGASDLEASYAMAWDYTYMYLGVKVHDDIHAQNATGANIFKGDSIELLLDKNLNYDFYTQSLNSDDYQLGISAGNSANGIAPSAYLWYPTGSSGTLSNVTIGYSVEDGGIYRYEARIPWSDFGVNPTNGLRMGIAVSVSDNDDVNQNVQQTMASSAHNRILSDPTTWGEIVLTK